MRRFASLCPQQTACRRPAAGRTAFDKNGFLLESMGWGGSEFVLAESQSRLYPAMRAKFGRDPTAVSKKVPFNFISRLSKWTPLSTQSCIDDTCPRVTMSISTFQNMHYLRHCGDKRIYSQRMCTVCSKLGWK